MCLEISANGTINSNKESEKNCTFEGVKEDGKEETTDNYIELNKDELIRLVIQKDTTLENYEHKINEMETNHKTEIDNMNDFYRARLNEHTHLIQYYERKLKVLKDIITIEEGGDK